MNDFLEMDNKEILDQNGGKKFSICIQNPPYAQTLYLKFLEKELDIADNIISINPSALIKRDSKHFDSYKKKFDPYLKEIEELNSDAFSDTSQQSVCIMIFGQDKKELNIKYLDGKEEKIQGILEKDNSGFSDYEKEIVKYLYNEKPNVINGASGGSLPPKKFLDKYIQQILNKLPDNKVYMVVNCEGPVGKAQFISGKIGQIADNKKELEKILYNRGGFTAHIMYFDNRQCAENCKNAMKRPLLRFPLLRTQKNHHLRKTQFEYIPNIDWHNIGSDYDILKACKCPENKINEYIEYIKNIINKIDKGK